MTDEERMRIIAEASRSAGISTATAMAAFAQAIRGFDRGWIDALRSMKQARHDTAAGEAPKEHMLTEE